MTAPTPDRTPTGDLRDRIAEALTREHYRRASERIEAPPEEHCAGFADAVLPVVEAETADLRKRLAYRHCQWQVELDARIRAEQRAEAAEAALAAAIRQTEAHADIRRQREIQCEQAERQRDAALAALRDLTDGRPCAPHPGNGWCQTHGERAPCPHAEAKKLATFDQPEET